ncbi:MAG: homoserine kinase, partial [Thermoprotei archaeon]
YQIVKAFLKKYDVIGVDIRIRIHKGVPPNSGLGSSGASGAGVAYGLFTIFRPSFSEKELLYIAGKGEEYVAGTPHYDNVAASLFGGIVLIDPLDMSVYKFKLSNPPRIVIVKPHIDGLDKKTKYARQILPKQIDLKTHVVQTSLLSKLLLGIITNDLELLGKAINQDYVAEPYRSKLIPYYWEVKAIALRHGALGVNIAGAGPSMFMLVRDQEDAEYIAGIVRDYYYSKNIPVEVFITTPNPWGTRIVERCC